MQFHFFQIFQMLIIILVNFFETEQIDKSINCYNKAISLNEKFALAHNNLAIAYLSKNSFTNSFIHSKKSLELEPYNKNYLYIWHCN